MCNGPLVFDVQPPQLLAKSNSEEYSGPSHIAALLTVQAFTAERTGALHNAAGQIRSLRLQLKRELSMIGDMPSQKIVAHEIERKFLIPRSVDIDHFCVGFVAISQQLHFASAIPRKVKRGWRVPDVLSVNLHERAGRIGIDGYATMHAADLCQREQQE